MAKSDSTYSKRPMPKVRPPIKLSTFVGPVAAETANDVVSGAKELKRQMGTAVQNVKAGYQKIKQSIAAK